MADTSLTILGPNSLTAAQIAAWCEANGKQASSALSCSIAQVAAYYIQEGADQGVRGDVAFAEACLETGYFAAPAAGALLAKNNFAGIAVPSAFSAGDGWPTPQLGVRAHIQLLAKVVGETAANFAHPDVSPGWGGNQTFTWGGLHAAGWAADPNYGPEIISIYNSILGGNPILAVAGGGSTTSSGPNVGGGISTTTVTNVAPGQIPAVDPSWTASAQVTSGTFRWPTATPTGLPSAAALAGSVTTESTVDLANGQLSQIQLTVADPSGNLTAGIPGQINQLQGDVGPYMMWGADVLVIAEYQTISTNRVPCAVLTLRTGCLQWMATRRVLQSWTGLSATQWLEQCVAEYNNQIPSGVPPASFLGMYTAPRPQIMANPSEAVVSWQSYYDIAQALCTEEGCWLFESGGTVVFGRPSWLATVAPTVRVGWPGTDSSWAYPMASQVDAVALDYPTCLRSVSLFTGDTMQIDVPHNVGEQMRVGQLIDLSGVPYFSSKQWLVTGVQFPFDGLVTPVTILANEVKDPVPSAPGGVAPSPPQSDPTGQAPTPTNLNFVDAALTQVGVPYAWGGTSPSTGFDCSGLVQWALEQLGITFPHYTGDQYATIVHDGLTRSPVDAMRIRGALLFKDSASAVAGEHVAISMGDGVNVLQAPYTGADVGVSAVPASYFNEAGLIPGVDYGTSGA